MERHKSQWTSPIGPEAKWDWSHGSRDLMGPVSWVSRPNGLGLGLEDPS